MTPEEELNSTIGVPGHWFHSIEVRPGVWTTGVKSRDQMEAELLGWGFPTDLTGKTVLDIGCADGGWSVAALKRGAKSVLAIDEQVTGGRRLLQENNLFPQIHFETMSLFSNEFMTLPTFDFVIFTGVLYHVQDMLEALKRVRTRANAQVLIETHVNESAGTRPPLAVFYETTEYNGDPTNWWGPNRACLEGMLRVAGFEFTLNNLIWENELHANGRVSYMLTAGGTSLFGDIVGGATGSNSMLEEARMVIAQLSAENARLKAQLAGSAA